MAGRVHVRYDQPESRLEFETLISDASASLLAAPMEQLHPAVERALESVRNFFRADRCALLWVSGDRQTANVRFACYADDVARVPPDANMVPLFPWSARRLLVEHLPLRVTRMSDLPPEAGVERPNWEAMSIRSALALPIEIGGGAAHLIVLHTVREERDWPDAIVIRLRVLGELLVGALQRKEMFDGLREVEARLSVAADSAEAGLWELDTGTSAFWTTARATEIFGCSPDAVISLERFKTSVHSGDWDLVDAIIRRPPGERGAFSVEYRSPRGDGRMRWIALHGRSHSMPIGQPPRLTGVCMDVTERRRLDETLRRSEANLASGADLAGLGYYEIDLGEGVATLDPRFRGICGVPPDREPGLAGFEFWLSRVHSDDRQRVLDIRERMHVGETEQISAEYRYMHPSHGERWIHHLARVARRDGTGRAVVTYGVIRDVTQRKRTDEELRGLSRRLIRAHEEERALLARELHDDVSQRLAVLAIDAGRVELAERDAAQRATVRSVREGLARLSDDVHAMAYQLHPSVLVELGLVEALRMECERFRRRGPVEMSMELGVLPTVAGKDEALCLFRVAQEALNNVLRHARARAVHVVLRHMDGGLLLSVRDDGVGFDPATAREGRSLGLASMRERLYLVDGSLDVESAPGGGTAIVAWVPATGAAR